MTGAWMPAVLSKDLPDGVVLPVRAPEGPLALWRSRSGRLAACADRCPHRGMRLSHGFVRGEALACIYHGWTYAASGACLGIPAHPGLTPPEAIRVRTCRVAEAGGLVWIAIGEPDGPPPPHDGLEPLRSLAAEAGHVAIRSAAHAGGEGRLGVAQDGLGARVLLGPEVEGQTVIHLMVGKASTILERVAASRWVEGVRRDAERREREGQGS